MLYFLVRKKLYLSEGSVAFLHFRHVYQADKETFFPC